MGTEFSIMVQQMLYVAILVAIGFLAGKVGVLTKQTLKALSGVITRILLPALILSMIPMENGRQELLHGLPVLLAAAVILALMFLLAGAVTGKLCRLQGTTYNIHLICATFGNMGLMGIPIISTVYGPSGLLFLSLYLVVDQTLLWTVGNLFLYKDTGSAQGFQLKKLLNPTTVALLIALVLLLCNVTPAGVLFTTVESLGGATKPLAMVYLGGMLCSLRLRDLKKQGSLFLLAAVKMILVPLIVWMVLGLLPGVFSPTGRIVLSLCAGMPTMLTIGMMAQSAGSDWFYGSQATLLTTLLSLGTLPLVSLLTTLIG